MPFDHSFRAFDEAHNDKDVLAELEEVEARKNNIVRLPGAVRSSPSNDPNDFEAPFRELVGDIPKGKKTTFKKERDHLISEMIFLKDRDASLQQSGKRIEACDLIAADTFPFEEIITATDPEDNRRLYDQISLLRTIYVNQLVTLDYLPGKDFGDQRGLARIELIRFLLRKTDLCYRKGIELNENNYDDRFLTDTELRLDKIQQDIRQLLDEAFAIAAHDPQALNAFKADVAALTTEETEPEVTLPTKAPELYKDRKDRSMKPVDFIENVYKEWLGKGLLRPHIKALDEPLYRALYKHGIPKSFEERLPKAAGKSGRPRATLSEDALERRRASDRERSRRLYHKRKQQAALE